MSRTKRLWVPLCQQRGLGLLDLLVIAAVVALLVFAASRQFALYQAPETTIPSATAPATPPA